MFSSFCNGQIELHHSIYIIKKKNLYSQAISIKLVFYLKYECDSPLTIAIKRTSERTLTNLIKWIKWPKMELRMCFNGQTFVIWIDEENFTLARLLDASKIAIVIYTSLWPTVCFVRLFDLSFAECVTK